MEADIIRRFRLANPFQPFRLVLADGREFEITKSHHLAIAQNNSRVLVVTEADTATWFSPEAVRKVTPLSLLPVDPETFTR